MRERSTKARVLTRAVVGRNRVRDGRNQTAWTKSKHIPFKTIIIHEECKRNHNDCIVFGGEKQRDTWSDKLRVRTRKRVDCARIKSSECDPKCASDVIKCVLLNSEGASLFAT
jgi:hypothetical protein